MIYGITVGNAFRKQKWPNSNPFHLGTYEFIIKLIHSNRSIQDICNIAP